MQIQHISAEYLPLPLVNPFVLSIRSTTNANLVRWLVRFENGSEQLAESVPVAYVTGETVESALALVPKLERDLREVVFEEDTDIECILAELLPVEHSTRAALEVSCIKELLQRRSSTLWEYFGHCEHELTTDVTISKSPDALTVSRAYYKRGFRAFKLKCGGENIEDDRLRIHALHRALPDITIRLDGNQGFTGEQAVKFLSTLEQGGIAIELFEQPVPKQDWSALDFIATRTRVPIIADEACVTPNDARLLFAQTAIAGVNVKVMKSGLFWARDIAEIARAHDKQRMIGCMLESSVGIAPSVALAAGLGGFDYIDLDGHFLIEDTVPSTAFETAGPTIRILE